MKQIFGAAIGLNIASLVLQFAAFASINKLEKSVVVPPRTYQIGFNQDSTFVYRDGKLIQAFQYQQNSIDSVIWHDNE